MGVTSDRFPYWELISHTSDGLYIYRCLIGKMSDGRSIGCLIKTDGYLYCVGSYYVDGAKPKVLIPYEEAVDLGDMECIKAILLCRCRTQMLDTIMELQRMVANMNARLSQSGIDKVSA